mmetsp:Transcript_72420/g.205569  ORF Transcript_72420/g.205569 Transcript_72420/m.205569 type:complete len:103 (-) Transcript_72420:676-984(-)
MGTTAVMIKINLDRTKKTMKTRNVMKGGGDLTSARPVTGAMRVMKVMKRVGNQRRQDQWTKTTRVIKECTDQLATGPVTGARNVRNFIKHFTPAPVGESLRH